jgi:protocatechuate 3,4-dioxygenase beta subunit
VTTPGANHLKRPDAEAYYQFKTIKPGPYRWGRPSLPGIYTNYYSRVTGHQSPVTPHTRPLGSTSERGFNSSYRRIAA